MSANPFVVSVARLRRVQGTRVQEERRGPLEAAEVIVPFRAADSPIRARWEGLCSRCTVPVDGELFVAVRERFCDEPTAGRPDDEDAYGIADDMVDLEPMLLDSLFPELPLAPLCRADCAGLCQHCGTDRNESSCDCVAPVDLRWANLDVLRS